MSDKLPWSEAINACRRRGEAWVLATVINTRGSSPRDSGSKMVITATEVFDTVGGGQLEFHITHKARAMLAEGESGQVVEHIPLSSKANQCCGGSVTVLLESFASESLNIHLFGAGHVAQALVTILGQLDLRIHWIDSRAQLFPDTRPANAQTVCLTNVLDHIEAMRPNAYALIITHDHALDYRLLEKLLDRKDCAYIGMIGSQTKASRFRKRLQSAAYSAEEIASVHTPIGLCEVPGKQPMEVAVSIAAQLIQHYHRYDQAPTKKGSGIAWHDIKDVIGRSPSRFLSLPALEHKNKT